MDIEQTIRDEVRSRGLIGKYVHPVPFIKSFTMDGTFHMDELSILVAVMRKYSRKIDDENDKYRQEISDNLFELCEGTSDILGKLPGESLPEAAKRIIDELNRLKSKSS